MPKKIMRMVLCFLSVFSATYLSSQDTNDKNKIGQFIDLNKNLISNYFDTDYQPRIYLNISFAIGSDFTPGYYYDKQGIKHEGLLENSSSTSFFNFKSNGYDKVKSVHPDKCNSYVIGIDSFTVIGNFNIPMLIGAIHIENEFAEVLASFNGYSFYKHELLSSQKTTISYLVKKNEMDVLTIFPSKETEFKQAAIAIFGSSENLKKGILNGKYKHADIPQLINYFNYQHCFEEKQKVYFSSSWDEINNPKKFSYYATIDNIVDTTFYISYYFMNGIKLFEGAFSSIYPSKNIEEFTYFYPNGSLRKKISYNNYKPEKGTEFHSNGIMHYQLEYFKDSIIYKQVMNVNGENVLNEKGTGHEVYYDSIRNITLHYEYLNHQLLNAYYKNKEGKKVYQICEKNAKLKKHNGLQIKMNRETKYPMESIKKYNHGYVLVSCIVEPSGKTSKLSIARSLDMDCDNTALESLDFFKEYKHWQPGQVDGEKITQEIVIPVYFSLNGFSKYRNQYTFDWHNHYMMQQQQINYRQQQFFQEQMQNVPSMPMR